jgi:hypothetical protein
VTLTAAEVNSGLTLHSAYTGSGQPVDLLTVTATNTAPGDFASSPSRTIIVTDPPPTPMLSVGSGSQSLPEIPGAGADSIGKSIALLTSYLASAFTPEGSAGFSDAFAGRAGALLGELQSLVHPYASQPAA